MQSFQKSQGNNKVCWFQKRKAEGESLSQQRGEAAQFWLAEDSYRSPYKIIFFNLKKNLRHLGIQGESWVRICGFPGSD